MGAGEESRRVVELAEEAQTEVQHLKKIIIFFFFFQQKTDLALAKGLYGVLVVAHLHVVGFADTGETPEVGI